jgi:hypothetical protein
LKWYNLVVKRLEVLTEFYANDESPDKRANYHAALMAIIAQTDAKTSVIHVEDYVT